MMIPNIKRYLKFIGPIALIALLFSIFISRKGMTNEVLQGGNDIRKQIRRILYLKKAGREYTNTSTVTSINAPKFEPTASDVHQSSLISTSKKAPSVGMVAVPNIFVKKKSPRRSSIVEHVNDVIVSPTGWVNRGPNKMRCRVHTVGCYEAADEYFMKDPKQVILTTSSSTMTDWYCIEICAQSRWVLVLAGIRNGNECLCSVKIKGMINLKESDKCDQPCVGDHSLKCGGLQDVTMLYRVLRECFAEPSPENAIVESSILGCYAKPLDLKMQMERYYMGKSFLAGKCLLHCEKRGLTLAVPVHPGHCLCGHTTPSFDLRFPVNHSLCRENFRNYVMVYRTWVEDRRCGDRRFLKEHEWRKSVVLGTFPGSGNTWMRHLIESATGIYTGSRYSDVSIVLGGHLGEMVPTNSKRVIVVKSHDWADTGAKSPYDAVIGAYRNPYDAILSEFTRRSAGGHTKVIDSEHFQQLKFDKLGQGNYPMRWRKMTETAILSGKPSMVFAYEDLVKDPITKTEEMARFIMGDLLDEEDLQSRILCLRLSVAGEFKRKKRPLDFDPYPAKTKQNVNNQIILLNRTLQNNGFPPLPDYKREL